MKSTEKRDPESRPSTPSFSAKLLGRVSTVFRRSLSAGMPSLQQSSLADAGQVRPEQQPPGAVSEVVRQVGRAGILLGRTSRLLFFARCDKGESWKMAYRFANGSMVFVVMAMAFVGMIMVYQSTQQMERTIGDTTLVGASFLKLLVRVLGPTVIGMLLACRVGAGIAAELGAMKVTEQLDALRMCGAEPVETLMVPRLRGGVVAGITLTAVGCLAAVVAGMYTGLFWFSMFPSTYLNFSLVTNLDVVQGLVKALVYGIAVPIVSGACGLAASGGARGVGQATTDAVVGSSFMIVVFDSLISMIAHVVEAL